MGSEPVALKRRWLSERIHCIGAVQPQPLRSPKACICFVTRRVSLSLCAKLSRDVGFHTI